MASPGSSIDCPTVTSGVGTTTDPYCQPGHGELPVQQRLDADHHLPGHVPSTSSGWDIRLDDDSNNGGDTSNFLKVQSSVTRSGSAVDSGTFVDINATTFCVASDASNSWNAGDILTVTIILRRRTPPRTPAWTA